MKGQSIGKDSHNESKEFVTKTQYSHFACYGNSSKQENLDIKPVEQKNL